MTGGAARRRCRIALFLALALLAAACTGGGDGTDGTSETEGPTTTLAAGGPTGDAGERGVVEVGPVAGNTASFGSTAQFTLRLASAPTANVEIPLSSSDEGEGQVTVSSVTFTPEDWFVPQTVVVEGTNEDVSDGVRDYTVIVGPAISDDERYDGVDPDDVALRGIELALAPREDMHPLFAGVPTAVAPHVTYTGSGQLSFALTDAPTGMAIDLSTGVIEWTPTEQFEGQDVPVTVTVNDGVRFADATLALAVLAPEPLDVSVEADVLEIVDPGSSLEGTSITQTAGDDILAALDLGSLPAEEMTTLPDPIVTLTDVLVVGGSHDADVVLRFPLRDLPAEVNIGDVRLLALTEVEGFQGADEVGPSWTTVGIDVGYEGGEDPVVAVSLAGLEGPFVLGYTAGATTGGAGSTTTSSSSTSGTCTRMETDTEPGTLLPHYRCTTSSGTITIRNWEPTVRTVGGQEVPRLGLGGTTLDQLATALSAAQGKFTEWGLGFDSTFTVQMEDPGNPRQGWVGGDLEARKTLHLNARMANGLLNPTNIVRSVAVHEYFHHVQGHPSTAIGSQRLFWGQRGATWLLESIARWFEDDFYDDLSSYTVDPGRGARMLEAGLAATGAGFTDPYARFAFFKLISAKCPSFKVKDILSASVTGDTNGLKTLDAKLTGWGCDFGSHLGDVRKDSLEAALVFYNYATQMKNDMGLFDSNEPTTFQFDAAAQKTAQQTVAATFSYQYPTSGTTTIPAAGALSFDFQGLSRDNTTAGKVLELVVESDQELIVSLASANAISGSDTIGTDSHTWFSTAQQSSFVFPEGVSPSSFVTLVNPSLEVAAASVKVTLKMRDALPAAPTISSPAPGTEVSNRVVTFQGQLPSAASNATVEVKVDGISSTASPGADGAFTAQGVMALGQNIVTVRGVDAQGNATTEALTFTLTGVAAAEAVPNALLESRVAFVLRWNTDATDIDIYSTYTKGTTAQTVWFNKKVIEPGILDFDTRTGFGPEVVTYRANPADGTEVYNDVAFDVDVHYFRGSAATSFTLDVILNETDGANRRVHRYASVQPLAQGNEGAFGPNGAGDNRLNDILNVTCNPSGVCSLASFDTTALAARE